MLGSSRSQVISLISGSSWAAFFPRGHRPLAVWNFVPVGLSGSGFAGSVLDALSPWGSKAFPVGASLSCGGGCSETHPGQLFQALKDPSACFSRG